MNKPGTEVATRPRADLSTHRIDPRHDWYEEARRLHDRLLGIYGARDPLPPIAGAWINRYSSHKTRGDYARCLLRWALYSQERGVHPFQAKGPLADSYASHLAQTPRMRPKKGGKPGEREAADEPTKNSSRAQALSACSSFYSYATHEGAAQFNPFERTPRPYVDPDYSPTEGFTAEEINALIQAAAKHDPRSLALVVLIYLCGPRISEILSLDVNSISYDRGHYYIPLMRKGDAKDRGALPPIALHALRLYIENRTEGPLFVTRTGRRWTSGGAWSHLRVLARKAEIPQIDSIKPHALRHQFVTDALEAGVPLEVVQDAAGHKDPRTTQRYNRRRNQLSKHPAYTLAAAITESADWIDPPG